MGGRRNSETREGNCGLQFEFEAHNKIDSETDRQIWERSVRRGRPALYRHPLESQSEWVIQNKTVAQGRRKDGECSSIMPLKRDMNRSSPHVGYVDAVKNVLAAFASDDFSSGGRRDGGRGTDSRREEEQAAFAL